MEQCDWCNETAVACEVLESMVGHACCDDCSHAIHRPIKPCLDCGAPALAAECPSCHTNDHPHTDYCRATEQQRILIPPGSLVASEAFVVPLEDPNDTGAADNEPHA